MNPIFLPIFIAVIQSAEAKEPVTKAREHANETVHKHSKEENHEVKAASQKSQDAHKEDHDHDHEKEAGKDADHGKEDGHAHADGAGEEDGHGHAHGEAEEENDSVGPEKGIIEANDKDGFKLSPEALKNFELKFYQVSGSGQATIPQVAIVLAGEEINLFRARNGFFKRIDFQTVRRGEKDLMVTSKDLVAGDQIVISGLGFLRIAELAAFGGMAEGHSH